MSSSSPPPVPPELKPITPYLARAHELATADPVIAYWCTYFAVQQAMTLGAKEPESQSFLFGIMDRLEAMKAENEGNEAVTEDAAASAYIENFGLKIFATADNEDRKGKATRATARKFLAAANFLELLSVFGEHGTENRDKIKYSKWKAADIAKAFREGRTPTPGPAGGLPEVEDPATQVNQVTSAEEKELTKEFEALVASKEEETTTKSVEPPAEDVSASYPFPQQPTTLPSAPPLPQEEEPEEEDPSRITTPALPTFIDDDERQPEFPSTSSSTPTRNEEVPTSSSSIDHQPFVINPETHLPPSHQTASLPTPSFHPPSEPPAFPSAVFPPAPPPSAPPQQEETRMVETLDPLEIAKVQKHARWAISALNYEDLETARKELREALRMLGG
ncbi:Vta1p [Sporobolomyces salmoneus]|uniref:Vta1p n=1 Tax=Sporobolomyces salmoneus TaxID=183962 RepID=UPI0031804916